MIAIKTNNYSIDKYCSMHNDSGLIYTKHVVTHGAPVSGKSHVAQVAVLYAISQGLQTMSTCLMGARANTIGGIHLNKWILLCDSKHMKYPFRAAKKSLEKLQRRPLLLYLVLTVDVVLIDEIGQESAEVIAALDVIFRKARNSTTPFGGVLILGTLDHTQ